MDAARPSFAHRREHRRVCHVAHRPTDATRLQPVHRERRHHPRHRRQGLCRHRGRHSPDRGIQHTDPLRAQGLSSAVLAVNGFAADGNMFVKKVKQRLEWYRHAHTKDMPLRAIARLIQTMLYAKRFFPYYVYNILSGIEEDGSGAVYSFDPVGSYEREACRAAGAAQSLVQPFLDNQIYFKNQQGAHPQHLPLPHVLALVTDSFTSATERHIEVGDGLEIYVLLAPGAGDELVGMAGASEVTTETSAGERVFVIRRELKKD
ncbi:amino-terminal nucleophile aminohydrolase [Ceratobasidium sp. AG-Ba]|nr:amino-terminal nucleophile aminohydrolase [Ceratobasidium sp. AG-Ba]QRV91836.1 amino-terminal nucleophile aminohydrolase [Ceratobasidium sp. AG-Ba]